MTELTAKNVDINVAGKTSLTGAMIDGSESLHLATNELEFKDLHDFERSNETGYGVNTGVGISTNKEKTNLHPNGETSLALNDKGYNKEQITHATIGKGVIEVAQGSDLTGLNRDTSKAQEITKDITTGTLDTTANIDNRVFTSEGRADIVKQHENLGENLSQIGKQLQKSYEKLKQQQLLKLTQNAELDKELQKYKQYGFAKELVESGAIGRLVLEGVMFLLGYENVDLNPDGTHKVYDDGTGVLTIGYGHVITKMDRETNRFTEEELSHGITEDKARDIFISDLKSPIQSAVNINKTVSEKFSSPLTDKQFSAIVSLVFNIGGGNWADSEAFRELRNSGQVSYDTWLKNVRNRKGEYMPGLENRRTAEYEIYKGGNYEIKQLYNR